MNPHSRHPTAPIATPEEASHGQHDHRDHGADGRDAGGGSGGHRGAAIKTGGGANVEYTCPMHPQVRQMRPGSCPICGMALEPVVATEATAIAALRAEGIRVVMLTGDGRITAQAVARQLGIDEVIADVLPQDKSSVVQRLKTEGRTVALAGDGVNDAPALAAADVGIAMGTGTDVAMESSGVTLLHGDLMGIARARLLSQATMKNIRTNLFFAFVYNAAGIPLAAGVLHPFFGILLSPVIAAAAMALSSVSVIANSLRLRTSRVID
nr:HAD-IC family P-type ATPase [Variovorax sp. CF079]